MREIKDSMDRGVQLTVEDGLFTVTHADGKLKLFFEDMLGLESAIRAAEDGGVADRPKPPEPEEKSDSESALADSEPKIPAPTSPSQPKKRRR